MIHRPAHTCILRASSGGHPTSVYAVEGMAVRYVITERSALLRSQLIRFEPLQQNAALYDKA